MVKGVVIVGLGDIGLKYDLHLDQDKHVYSHARAFSQHKDFNLLAAVDDNLSRRDIFTHVYKSPAYSDLSEALRRHKPDVVVIATTTQTHAEILFNILEEVNPMVILCEKPLSYDLSEAQEMVEMCERKKVSLYVNFMRRSDTGVVKIKNLIDSKTFEVGIKGVTWYSKGFIHNGSHFFNLLEYWLGPMKGFNLLSIDRILDDDCELDVEVEFENGKIMFLAAWEESFSHYSIELLLPSGRIRYDDRGATIQVQNVISDPIFKGYRILNPGSKNIETDMRHSQLNVVKQLALFVNGKPSHLCSGKAALTTLASMLLIIDEIKNG